jgi:TatD DNase family protein
MSQITPYIDIHSHGNKKTEAGIVAIKNLLAGEMIPELSEGFFSVGIHPWQLEEGNIDQLKQQFQNSVKNPQVIAIGEAGLDKAIQTPLEEQIPVFRMQIEMAEEIKKPLIIHAVRAFGEIIQLRKSTKAKAIWIVHGFRGGPETALQLLNHGIFLSFGSALLKEDEKLNSALRVVPNEQLFLETDESSCNIEEVYQKAAIYRKQSLDVLKSAIFANFARCFTK